MTAIKLLAETRETVTLRRADFLALLQAAEDAEDLAAVEAHRAHEKRVGWETARRDYLTVDEARRLLDGENGVRVWRKKRGMKQRALAGAAQVAVSYLAEIEAGKKPGSAEALQRIANILEIPMEDIAGSTPHSGGLRPVTRAGEAAARLAKIADETGDPDRLRREARTIVSEWRGIAKRNGVTHQVTATIGCLVSRLSELSTTKARVGSRKRASDALEAAIDALGEEYHRL
jgi:transcriptional regulator with XRE-family HTH domain